MSNLDEVRALSDRQLAEATFMVLCALSERLTGQVPVVVTDGYAGMPEIIHAGDGPVVWLTPRAPVSLAPAQKHESPPEQPDMPLAIAEPVDAVRARSSR